MSSIQPCLPEERTSGPPSGPSDQFSHEKRRGKREEEKAEPQVRLEQWGWTWDSDR